MFSLVRNIGSSIGISIVVTILGHETQVSHAALSESITQFNHALHGPGCAAWNLSTTSWARGAERTVTKQAVTIAYLNDFRLMMYLTLLAAPLLLLIRPPTKRAPAQATAAVRG